MKYVLLSISSVFLVLISACGSVPAPTTSALSPVNVCYSALSGTQTVVWYAYENLLFQKYGLDVNLIYISSGTQAVTALIAGSADICQVAGSAVVNSAAAGQDAVLIAGLYDIFPASLMVTPDIRSPQDLKGKALAVTSPGSSVDVATRMALTRLGLVPDTDVALIAFGDELARLAAMDAGEVAGTILVSPDTLLARQRGYVELVDLAASELPYQQTGLASSRSYLKAHPDEATAFMKAILDAIAQMKKDPEGTKAVMAKYLLYDPAKDAAALADAYDTLVVKDLLAVPFPSLTGIQTIIDYQASSNPSAAQITAAQVADSSILDDLQKSGFIDQLGK